jgi:signal transduction histidine kinase
MERDTLHAQIFDAVRDPMVVIDDHGAVYAANAAALRLFDLAVPGQRGVSSRRVGFDLDVAALAAMVGRRQRMSGVALTDRAGRDTGVVVDIDPSVGPTHHALLHFRARTDALARELWTEDTVTTVAHELRNPLSSMRSALNVLRAGDAGPLTDAQRRFIDTVQRGVGRLARLVDGYLDLGRMRAGVLTVDRGARDVRTLIDDATADLVLCNPALASRIDVEIDAASPVAYVDSDRVTQVLLNLVYNAARFTPEARRIRVRARPAGREALPDPLRVLPFELFGEPHFVCIEVEDEGIGMSADALAHVFDRYHTDARDGDTTAAGAHLGLHISRALVEAQDGWMRMESRLGEGTTAAVWLPADAATARLMSRLRAAEEAVQRLRAARRPVTVALIADDEIRAEEKLPGWWPAEWATHPEGPGGGARPHAGLGDGRRGRVARARTQ